MKGPRPSGGFAANEGKNSGSPVDEAPEAVDLVSIKPAAPLLACVIRRVFFALKTRLGGEVGGRE